jgi:prepilin-type N-terminal cleavage/methylation domain-containing protein
MLKKYDRKGAFTLVEISIVIVIIGLVLGGVLVGRDLIAAAEMRAVISQQEQIKTAVMTFKTKYAGLPGDMNNAAAFGFASTPSTIGNADGCISVCYGSFTSSGSYYMTEIQSFDMTDNGFEIPNFWRHLSQAGLISGTYDGNANGFDSQSVGKTMPPVQGKAKLGWVVYANYEYLPTNAAMMQSLNDFGVALQGNIGNYMSMFLVGEYDRIIPPIMTGEAFSPLQAKALDDKIDDGFPGSGMVRANYTNYNDLAGYDWDIDAVFVDGLYYVTPPPGSPTLDGLWCAYVPTGKVQWAYNVQDGKASCGIRIRAGF